MRTVILCLALTAAVFSAQTTLTVKEGIGVARSNEPVSGGIAFPKGAAPSISQLALFDGTTEIPAQFFPLVSHTDGSVEWALVDFTAALSANGEKSYTIKTQAPSTTPAPSVSVSRSGSVITIANGVLSFSFDTVDFKGIESLEYNGKSMLNGAGGLSVFDMVKGSPDTNGLVTKGEFIYLGPLRATYRVEGEFYKGACGGLGYSYMMTVYAGSPRVTIDASIRNSINANCGRLAKIARASASFKLGFDPAKTVAYDTLAGHKVYMYTWMQDTLRSTRAFEDNAGDGLIVTDKWSGGAYNNCLNRTIRTGRDLAVDMIQPVDTMPLVNSYGTIKPGSLAGYVADSTAAGPGRAYTYYLLDYANKNSRITLECYSGGMDAASLRNKMLAAKHRLVPRQSPADLSASGALSFGRFGTLEDEQTFHSAMGWQACDPLRNGDAYHNDWKIQFTFSRPDRSTSQISRPDCAPWMEIGTHFDQEADYLQGFLQQWLRYGDRDFFDMAEATGRFWSSFWTLRSAGFTWDGQYAPQSWISLASKRTQETFPTDDCAYFGFSLENVRVDIKEWGGCHFIATGLTDYYCLTGDPDALDACRDLYEIVKVFLADNGGNMAPADTADSKVEIGSRGTNRKLSFWIRYYELTKDPAVLSPLQNYMRAAMKTRYRDPYFWIKYPYKEASWSKTPLKQYKLTDSLLNFIRTNHLAPIQSRVDGPLFDSYTMMDSTTGEIWPLYFSPDWTGAWLAHPLENWLNLFPNDDDVRDHVIGIANYYVKIMSAHCGLGTYGGVISDFPKKGMYSGGHYQGHGDTLQFFSWLPAHAQCKTSARGSETRLHDVWSEAFLPGIEALGFRYTGRTDFLRQSEREWGYVSANYPIPGTADQPAMYARYDAWEWWHNDMLTMVTPLFYEKSYHTDTLPPEAVTDLGVSRLSGNTGLVFSWSAPAGGAVSYQLKYFKDKPLADYPDLDYSRPDSTKCPWWFANNVQGEPLPSGTGSPENFTLPGNFPVDSMYYAALCSRDSAGNLSLLSNVVRIDNTINVEIRDNAARKLKLTASPNPFNPAISIILYGAPAKGVAIKVYDPTGRFVADLSGQVRAGRVVWNASGCASGMYVVKATAGKVSLMKKIMMVK